jgi:general stress protein 26
MQHDESDAHDKLWDMIRDIRFAMVTTRAADGRLRTRPLTMQNREQDQGDSLWFFVSRGGEPFAELQADERVSVAFADAGKDRYVALSGTAQPVDDPARKQRLWSKMNEAWFPNGPDDPDVALVQVRIDEAEYWDVKESKLVQMLKMARSAATGHPPADLGDHGRVRMH